MEVKASWKQKMFVIGTVSGAVVGLLATYLYTRAAEEGARASGTGKARKVTTGEFLSLGLAALALIRQITELGSKK